MIWLKIPKITLFDYNLMYSSDIIVIQVVITREILSLFDELHFFQKSEMMKTYTKP